MGLVLGIDRVLAHGGFYKTDFVGQNATSAVLNVPVTVMQTAAEGGAWGMALLALYAANPNKSLAVFLDNIFADAEKKVVMTDEEELEKFNVFMKRYRNCLSAEKLLSELL